MDPNGLTVKVALKPQRPALFGFPKRRKCLSSFTHKRATSNNYWGFLVIYFLGACNRCPHVLCGGLHPFLISGRRKKNRASSLGRWGRGKREGIRLWGERHPLLAEETARCASGLQPRVPLTIPLLVFAVHLPTSETPPLNAPPPSMPSSRVSNSMS